EHERHPRGEELLRVDRDVREETVDLLDAVFGIGLLREGQRSPDGGDAERGGVDHAGGRLRERQDPLRVKVFSEGLVDEAEHVPSMHANPRSVSTLCAPGVRALRVAAGTRAATGRGLLHASPEHHGLAEIPSESRYSEAPYEMRGSLRVSPTRNRSGQAAFAQVRSAR